jgi:heme-degrading monooxygenase HmoA
VITRIWHGRSKTEDAETYKQFVIETGVSDYKSIKWNLGCQIWQQQENDVAHIYTVSWWDSYKSIKQFAGEDYSKVKYYEEDKQYLLKFEPEVQHFDCHDFRNLSYLQPEYRHRFKVVL